MKLKIQWTELIRLLKYGIKTLNTQIWTRVFSTKVIKRIKRQYLLLRGKTANGNSVGDSL